MTPIDSERVAREIAWRTSRSSGPGGQSVNKSETRVEAIFNVLDSAIFTDEEKERIQKKLASRLTMGGNLIVAASEHRSQLANKRSALARIITLLGAALKVDPERKRSKPSKATRQKRMDEKIKQSEKKRSRGWRPEA